MVTQYKLIDNIFTSRLVKDAIKKLFSEDGKVYLIAGYFNLTGYQVIKKEIKTFLNRDDQNQIKIIVGTDPNQFSATIAHDLWEMEIDEDQIELLKYNDEFVHTKHYVRESENPAVILGSANFTLEGFQQHLELVSYYEAEDLEDSIAQQHINWFKSLVAECECVTEEDLERYEELKIDVNVLEEFELLNQLGVSIEEIKKKLRNPDSFPAYKLNLLSRYLELEDTTKATLAVKSRIKKYPHQVIAGAKAYKNLSYNNFYLLADEVGLGKTFEAGLAYKQLKLGGKVERCLIICRSSAMKDWENAFNKFFEDPTLITSSRKSGWKKKGLSKRDIWLKDDLMICTHEMFRQAVLDDIIDNEMWDMLIVDEAHVVKNNDSKIHNVIKNFDVKYKLFLTATPVQNREKEFYNLFDAMNEGFLGSTFQSYKSKGERYLKDLLQGEEESFLSRYLREDLPYMEIPPREVHDNLVSLTEEEMETYNMLLEFLHDLIDRNPETASQLVAVTYKKIGVSSWFALETSMKKLREKHRETTGTTQVSYEEFEKSFNDDGQSVLIDDEEDSLEVNMELLDDFIKKLETLTVDSKIDSVIDNLSDALEEEDRVVIFTQYKRNILDKDSIGYDVTGDNLYGRLKESSKIDCPIYPYHGSMNTTERYETRENFKKTGGIFIATEAGAESINLQHCNVLINYDIPWNPARIEQRIGRVQRLGQEKEVLVSTFVLRGTLDETIYSRVIQKHNLLHQRFGTSEEVTDIEALEAVESGSIGEIKSTSQILMDALKNRRDSEEIKEYFEDQLIEREDELKDLRSKMEDSLEDFDDRIKVLLTGKEKDTSEEEKEIKKLTEEYKETLEYYLKYFQVMEDITLNFQNGEVEIEGDRELLGDNKIRTALDGETSLAKDIPLLTPSSNPLRDILNHTKKDFSLTALENKEGILFDFHIQIESTINTIQKILRVKVNQNIVTKNRIFPEEGDKADDCKLDIKSYLKSLRKAYEVSKDEAEKILDEEKEKLESFIKSEISRLRKRETEKRTEKIKTEVKEPIKLQKGKVEDLKEKVKKGKAKGMDLKKAREELKKRKSQKNEKIKEIRKEVKNEFENKIKQIRQEKEKCEYEINLVSSCLLGQ